MSRQREKISRIQEMTTENDTPVFASLTDLLADRAPDQANEEREREGEADA